MWEEFANLIRLYHVDEGKSIHASEARVDSAVKHDLLVLELHNVTASAHLQSWINFATT